MAAALLVLLAVGAAVLDQATKARVARPLLNARGAVVALPLRAALALWAALATYSFLLVALDRYGALGAAGLGLSLGGAAGNLADRLRDDGVRDFIVVGRWPPFNLADVAIAVGAGLVAVDVL